MFKLLYFTDFATKLNALNFADDFGLERYGSAHLIVAQHIRCVLSVV
jgi:hypothetical protein